MSAGGLVSIQIACEFTGVEANIFHSYMGDWESYAVKCKYQIKVSSLYCEMKLPGRS